MNLYTLHPDPENAPGYATRYDTVPELVWERYKDQPEELKKREKALAKEAMYAYKYASEVLKGPFPAGEAVLVKDRYYAYWYALGVLRRRWPAAEAAIFSSIPLSRHYRKVFRLPGVHHGRASR